MTTDPDPAAPGHCCNPGAGTPKLNAALAEMQACLPRIGKDAKSAIDVPVQRGRNLPSRDMPDALEILSGLKTDDVLVQP